MTGIPNSQLETWSHRGATKSAKNTHLSIRNGLKKYQHWPENVDYEVYLQGSYKNSTNIRRDSDVDLVTQLNKTFTSDKSELSDEEKWKYDQAYSDATYLWKDFRKDILQCLLNYYDPKIISEGNKTLKIGSQTGLLAADVVVCYQFRKYISFNSIDDQNFIEGMKFYDYGSSEWIINYPKLNLENCTIKSEQTNGNFKAMVRIFKNIRTKLVEDNIIYDSLAPSYFIESLLYNLPDQIFTGNCVKSFSDLLELLNKELNSTKYYDYTCPNEIVPLIGSSLGKWPISDVRSFISELIKLWNEW